VNTLEYETFSDTFSPYLHHLTIVQPEEEIKAGSDIMVLENGVARRRQVKCPAPTITLSSCGLGFKFTITRGGSPDNGNFNYNVKTTQGGVSVDSGIISYGQNTNWVLTGCTSYDVEIFDWCVGLVTITVTSDGCGNLWVC